MLAILYYLMGRIKYLTQWRYAIEIKSKENSVEFDVYLDKHFYY